MRQSAMVIINPTAGKEKAGSYEEQIKETLKEKYINVLVKHTKGEGDARRYAEEASENNFDLVVSLGGDGTVNETVNGLAAYDQPPTLGIVPLGTVNSLARALNIPINTNKAIEILNNDYYKEIDVGLVNGRYFTNALAIGRAAEAIYDVEVEEKTKIGPLAYIKAIGKEILQDEKFVVTLETDEEKWEDEVSVVIIGLLDSLGGLRSILSDVDIADGTMHVLAIKSLNVSKLLTMTPSLALGNMRKSDNATYFQTKKLNLETTGEGKPKSNVDGDEGPDLPLTVEVLTKHLKVISRKT